MRVVVVAAFAVGVVSAVSSGTRPGLDSDEQQISAWNSANLGLYVQYFRHHGVSTVCLVACSGTGGGMLGRGLKEIVRGLLESRFYVSVLRDGVDVEFALRPQRYKSGVILDLDGGCAEGTLKAADKANLFTTNRFWLLVGGDGNVPDVFIPPDGEVRLLTGGVLVDVFKISREKPMTLRSIGRNLSSTQELVHSLQKFGSTISYRGDLQGVKFKTGLVIAFPDMFTHIEDQAMRHIDTITKVNYPLVRSLGHKLNMSFDTLQTDNWGWRKPNGSFDGLVGRFQRRELDFAQNAIFMRLDRVAVVDFVVETYRIRAGIMFRQPPLSAVANIFALPFNTDVWITILVFMVFTASVMLIEKIFSHHLAAVDSLDCLVFVWGALCQQGSHLNIPNRSARILVFTTFITTLFLFTSFSANIVALLQSPSTAISSLADLGQSPLEIGVQDTAYNKVFFNESTDPVTKTLFLKKIQPKGERVYMRPDKGMERVRTGLFAYQVELQAGYQVISDTFDEVEKCGLKELEPFKLPMLAIPVRKDFPYKELFRRQIRWQREVGLMKREELKWCPQKPKCESSVGGFVSIGITECRYAFAMFGYGLLAAVVALMVEILVKRSMWCLKVRALKRNCVAE